MTDILDELFGPANEDSLSTDCSCGGAITEQVELERVDLGAGDFFEVEVPVLRCACCGFSFRDHRAEELRHAGACRHEGLLAPNEVRAIRDGLQMTRKTFGEAFGIPPASMERWENGKLMQNKSMDSLLRSLMIPGVAGALDRRRGVNAMPDGAAAMQKSNVIYADFGALSLRPASEQEDAVRRAQMFKLQAFK